MSIRAVLFDLDNTLTHRGRSVAAFSQSLVDYYQSQLNCVDVEQIESIVNRIDNGGYPFKEVFNSSQHRCFSGLRVATGVKLAGASAFRSVKQFLV